MEKLKMGENGMKIELCKTFLYAISRFVYSAHTHIHQTVGNLLYLVSKVKLKAVEAYRVEIRIPHCLDNRLTDGCKVVSLMYQPQFTPQKHFSASGIHFC
jgi:hypothetical protein